MYENDGSLFKVDGVGLLTRSTDGAARVIDTALHAGRAETRDGGVWLDDRAALTMAEGLDDLISCNVALAETKEAHEELLERYREASSELQDLKARLARLSEVAAHQGLDDADQLAALLAMLQS